MKKSNWKNALAAVCLGSSVLAGFGPLAVYAANSPRGGDGVPSPFADTNRFVDLADGETYTLVGRIEVRGTDAFFEVNLQKQPWLATSHTRANPFFRLTGDTGRYYSFDDSKVKMIVRAHGQVVTPAPTAEGASPCRYEISLTPAPKSSIEVLR